MARVSPEPNGRLTGGERTRRRRRLTTWGIVARAFLLLALVVLGYWQATHSPALAAARESESRSNFANAARYALEHLDRRPWSREAALVVARCLSRLDFAEGAEPYYRRGGSLSVEDQHYRAYGLVRANLRDRAIAAYREILEGHPQDVTALQMMAGVLISQSRWDEVRTAAGRLIEIPDGPATIYKPIMSSGNWTLKPVSVPSVQVIGWTLEGVVDHDTQEYGSASVAFERVLELDPDLRSMPLQKRLFWSHFAEDLLRVGRQEDAIRFLSKAINGGVEPDLMDQMGQAYEQDSDEEQAERCWRQVLEWAPDHFGALLNLGLLELRRSRKDEALRLLKRALEQEPESSRAHYSLGLAYRGIDNELSRQHMARAERIRARTGQSSEGGDVSTGNSPPAAVPRP